MERRRVLVVGGGIAGMSFATAASRRGIDVSVIELMPRVVGVGIFLSGNTLRALDDIGLAQSCVDEGWPIATLRLFDTAGNMLEDRPMPRVAGPDLPPSAAIPRRTLARILQDKAEAAGATVRVGLTVDEITGELGNVSVRLSDGSRETYDLVVGADGIYSRVRELVFGAHLRPRPIGQGGWRFMTARHPSVDAQFFIAGDNRKVGFIPLDQKHMYVLSTVADPNGVWVDNARTPELFREVLAPVSAPLVQEMCGRLDVADPATVMWRPFEVLFLDQPWYRDGVVLIGDAVHSMTPHLTSGGGMAIEDAAILARHLARNPDLPDALKRFFAQRFERTRMVQNLSIAICQEEISPAPSRDRMYDLTMQGYNALAVPFLDESEMTTATGD